MEKDILPLEAIDAINAVKSLREEDLILPKTKDIEFFCDGIQINGYWSGQSAKGKDGNFYFAPSSAKRVLCFDQSQKRTRLIGPELDEGHDRYSSAVADKEGNIYFIPFDADRVLCLQINGDLGYFGDEVGSNIRKWSCGALASDGRIYCPPNHATGVLCIDPMEKKTSIIMSGPEIPLTDGKWVSCVLSADNKIYCAPCHISHVLCIDPLKGVAYRIGEDLGNQRDKFHGACTSTNGEKVFFAPRSTRKLLSIDTNNQSTRLIDLNLGIAIEPTSLLFCELALGADSLIYLFPCINVNVSSAKVFVFDTETESVSAVSSTSYNSDGSFLADDGYIYCLSGNSHWIRTDSKQNKKSPLLSKNNNNRNITMMDQFIHKPQSFLLLLSYIDCTYRVDICDWLSSLQDSREGIVYLDSCFGSDEVSIKEVLKIPNLIQTIIEIKCNAARSSLLRMPFMWKVMLSLKSILLEDNAVLWRKLILSDIEGFITNYLITCDKTLQIELDSSKTLLSAIIHRSSVVPRLINRGISITNNEEFIKELRNTNTCQWLVETLINEWLQDNMRIVFSDPTRRLSGFLTLLQDVYGTKQISTFIGEEFQGTELWHGAATGLDGKVYCSPRNDTHVLCIDNITGSSYRFGPSLSGIDGGPNEMMWIGAACGGDGRIFCAPFNALKVLCIDPINSSVTTIGYDLSKYGSNKWATAVCGLDGNVYCLPFDAPCVLCINPFTETVTTFGENLIGPDFRFVGACIDRTGNVYGLPMFGSKICCVDTVLRTFSVISGNVGEGGEGKWAKPVLGYDGCLYACPGGTNRAIRFDPTTSRHSMIGDDFGFVGWKWHDNVVGADGNVYGLPVTASNVMKLDISKQTATCVGIDLIKSQCSHIDNLGTLPAPWGWMSGSLSSDGCIYCPPSRGRVLRIDTSPPFKRISCFLSIHSHILIGGQSSVDTFNKLIEIAHFVSSDTLSTTNLVCGTSILEKLMETVAIEDLILTGESSWVREKDDFGQLPLHFALQSKAKAEIVLLLLDAYPDAVRVPDCKGQLPLEYALEQQHMSQEILKVLLFYDLPYDSNGSERVHSFSWTTFLRYEDKLPLEFYSHILECVYNNNPLCFHKYASAKDQRGAVAYDFVKPSLRTIFNSFLLWFGRYRITALHPEHTSATCFVYKALDETSIGEDGNPLRVALKLMFDKSQFIREVNSRSVGFSTDRVINVIRTHPESTDSEEFCTYSDKIDVGIILDGLLSKAQVEKLFCIVMPLADRNLFVAVKQDRFAGGQNMEEVRNIFRQIVESVQHMHSKGFVHADIKPLNIVRVGSTWKLIDLDAVARINVESVGSKFSSAYDPPEIVNIVDGKANVRNDLIACTSFDVWSLGCILYQFVNNMAIPLFQGSLDDNLANNIDEPDSLFDLKEWNNNYKLKKLIKITDGQARNLVSQMLNKDPLKRSSLERVLSHPFISKKSVVRMVGDEAQFQVFLSYRVASDFDNANKLYDMLTARGVSVWWDKKCLKNGEKWEDGFCSGLLNSDSFVCLLSRKAINADNNVRQNFSLLTPDSSCDNVLLEHQLALELYHIGTIRYLFPVFIGDELEKDNLSIANNDNSTYHSDYFSSGCHPRTPNICVNAVKHKLQEHMEKAALGSPYFPNRTVSEVCNEILACQGAFIKGERECSFETTVENIVIMCKDSETVVEKLLIEEQLRTCNSEKDVIIKDLEEKLAVREKEITEFRTNLNRMKYIPFFS